MTARRIYWRPRGMSRTVSVLIAVLALASLVAVERFRVKKQQPYFKEKLAAARLALDAMNVIKAERDKLNIPIDHEADPALTGLIGSLMTPTTSNTGFLAAKQISVNPNFAAVIVQMLKRAGVRSGDTVALGCSGSFPALNICTYAAIKTLGLKPVIIASAASSQWGANHPNFLWVDMESVLKEKGVFPFRSVAASVGGVEDRGLGLSSEGRQMLLAGISRNHLPLINAKDYEDSIEQRMNIYREKAEDSPIKVYISIGGGTTSVGTRVGKRLFRPGLNFHEPAGASPIDSVMARFVTQGVPVIHLIKVEELAHQYGLPVQPSTTIPSVGQGEIFRREEYSYWLAGGALATILLCLFAFVRLNWGVRFFGSSHFAGRSEDRLEPMI